MPNAITTVGFGSPYAAEQMDIQRRQKLAEMLQKQSMEPIQQQQGGMFTPRTGWAQMLAKGVQAYKGKQGIEEGKTQQEALAQKMQQERQQALAQALQQGQGSPQPAPEMGGGPAMPPDPVGAMGALAQSSDPSVLQAGAPAIQMQQQIMKQQQDQQFRAQQAQQTQGVQQQQADTARQDRLQREQAARQQQGDMARLTASLRPSPTDQQKPPPGYRPSAAGDLEAIPGGPADMKQRGQFNQDTGILQASTSGLDRLGSAANALLKHPGLSKSTGLMSVVPGVGGLVSIPGTDAANFKAGLDTLKSQVGFSVLQEMRNNSKTGGALGQVSDRENVMLQNNLAALDRSQSEPEFKAALQQIVDYTDAAKDRLRSAFNMKHGDVQEQATPQRRSTDKLTPKEQQELDALRKRFGR